jgi:hypothetical protein
MIQDKLIETKFGEWLFSFKFVSWFLPTHYVYIFSKPFNLTKMICRIKGHPNGPIFYNPNGLEPDGRCIDCGDEIA